MGTRRGELALLALGMAAAIGLAEAAVRLAGLTEPRPTGYAPVASGVRAALPRNSRGYRDRERSFPKPPGVRRVVCLGDSFTWGHGVEFGDAYPQRLERALPDRVGGSWEVVNLSMPAMGTLDARGVLEREGLAYAPDAVLLGYVLNDAEDASSAEARRAEDWRLAKGPPAWPIDRLALIRLARLRLWAAAENRRRVANVRALYAPDAPGWAAVRNALTAMGVSCHANDVPFVVAIFPLFGNPLDDRYPFADQHRQVAEAARAAGAEVVDLLPTFRGLRWDLLVVDGADDEHPNEVAHRIAANRLLRALLEALGTRSASPAMP
jgi:lysophospholipase L1-like esterase